MPPKLSNDLQVMIANCLLREWGITSNANIKYNAENIGDKAYLVLNIPLARVYRKNIKSNKPILSNPIVYSMNFRLNFQYPSSCEQKCILTIDLTNADEASTKAILKRYQLLQVQKQEDLMYEKVFFVAPRSMGLEMPLSAEELKLALDHIAQPKLFPHMRFDDTHIECEKLTPEKKLSTTPVKKAKKTKKAKETKQAQETTPLNLEEKQTELLNELSGFDHLIDPKVIDHQNLALYVQELERWSQAAIQMNFPKALDEAIKSCEKLLNIAEKLANRLYVQELNLSEQLFDLYQARPHQAAQKYFELGCQFRKMDFPSPATAQKTINCFDRFLSSRGSDLKNDEQTIKGFEYRGRARLLFFDCNKSKKNKHIKLDGENDLRCANLMRKSKSQG